MSSEVIRGWLARREYAEKSAQRHAAALCIQTGKAQRSEWEEREREYRRGSLVQKLTMMCANNH